LVGVAPELVAGVFQGFWWQGKAQI